MRTIDAALSPEGRAEKLAAAPLDQLPRHVQLMLKFKAVSKPTAQKPEGGEKFVLPFLNQLLQPLPSSSTLQEPSSSSTETPSCRVGTSTASCEPFNVKASEFETLEQLRATNDAELLSQLRNSAALHDMTADVRAQLEQKMELTKVRFVFNALAEPDPVKSHGDMAYGFFHNFMSMTAIGEIFADLVASPLSASAPSTGAPSTPSPTPSPTSPSASFQKLVSFSTNYALNTKGFPRHTSIPSLGPFSDKNGDQAFADTPNPATTSFGGVLVGALNTGYQYHKLGGEFALKHIFAGKEHCQLSVRIPCLYSGRKATESSILRWLKGDAPVAGFPPIPFSASDDAGVIGSLLKTYLEGPGNTLTGLRYPLSVESLADRLASILTEEREGRSATTSTQGLRTPTSGVIQLNGPFPTQKSDWTVAAALAQLAKGVDSDVYRWMAARDGFGRWMAARTAHARLNLDALRLSPERPVQDLAEKYAFVPPHGPEQNGDPTPFRDVGPLGEFMTSSDHRDAIWGPDLKEEPTANTKFGRFEDRAADVPALSTLRLLGILQLAKDFSSANSQWAFGLTATSGVHAGTGATNPVYTHARYHPERGAINISLYY